MEETQRYYDFCVPYNTSESHMKGLVGELVEMGYRTIAIEQKYDHTQKDKTKRQNELFPDPVNLQYLRDEFKNQVKILQRITIIYADTNVAHAMAQSLTLKKYDLIAGQPKSDAALSHCCTSFIGDIITFDSDAGLKLMTNRKSYKVAVQRGMFFEIKYAPLIVNVENRKIMIKMARNYLTIGKSKNIIFSSGALNQFQVRGPYDIANLAFIFSLNESQGKNAIDLFCRKLYVKAQSRRIGKTVMFIKPTGPVVFSDTSEEEDAEEEDDETGELDATMDKLEAEIDAVENALQTVDKEEDKESGSDKDSDSNRDESPERKKKKYN